MAPPYVVKTDGLAAGKGVLVTDDLAAAEADVRDKLSGSSFGDAGRTVVIEEGLTGPEVSVFAVCDGTRAVALGPAQDFKRVGDGDTGPNTGGMGAFSPLPDFDDEAIPVLLATIHRPILAELERRGAPFTGALYAGLMLTDQGPVLLECNARFGDPETQVLLPRVATALGPLLLAAARGRLGAAASALGLLDGRIPTTPDVAVGIVLAAHGYPEAPRNGDTIHGLDEVPSTGALVFHAGTEPNAAGGGFRTRGGRVLTVVGRARDVATARARAEAAADLVHWDGLQRRHDIAAELVGIAT
jgi:phosphoribosylamine--glycine ligase